MDIDAQGVRSNAFAMEWIDPAMFAKKVPGGLGVELIFGECISTSEQPEPGLWHFHHQGILAFANRTIAGREFRKIRFDFKLNSAAMATSAVAR